MALRTTIDINVDFYDKKYILINAKQLDKNSRFLSVTCYNHGTLFTLSTVQHSAYIRYKKADGHSVFNVCEISEGKVIVQLTEQMLAVDGMCYADLVIVEGGKAVIDVKTGAITGIEGSSILSTMTFCIDVSETAIDISKIESDSDFNALNETLDRANAHYQNVVKMAESWAVGGTGVRNGEDINNAKYWAELAHLYVVGDLEDQIVTGIKVGDAEAYQTGFINITAEDIGAVSTTDIATVSEVTDYLGI